MAQNIWEMRNIENVDNYNKQALYYKRSRMNTKSSFDKPA